MTAREFRTDPVSQAVVVMSVVYLVASAGAGDAMDGSVFVAGMCVFAWLTTFVFDLGRV